MPRIIDRACLYICCIVLVAFGQVKEIDIVALLVVLLLGCMGYYVEDRRIMSLLIILYGTLNIYQPVFCIGFPIVVYELTSCVRQTRIRKDRSDLLLLFIAMLTVAATVYRAMPKNNIQRIVILLCLSVIAIVLNLYDYRMTELRHTLIRERDTGKELTIALKDKNRYLIEKQDADLHLAMLKERNRIAREIHDNVGHMLSRSILLTGAMSAVNQDPAMKEMLDGLQDTLNGAMTSIRSSVHDLHDESIDLKSAVGELLKQLDGYRVNYEFDMQAEIPREIKYCFISIVKEAVTNIMKHSDADRVDVILMEHPSFFQLQVNDNGKCVNKGDGTGIGLENIRDRVESFQGTLNINNENGYKIFVNIPKKGEK